MKKALVVVFLLYVFLFVSARVAWIGAQFASCGSGTYYTVTRDECEDASTKGLPCPGQTHKVLTSCIPDNNNKCLGYYHWTSCTSQWDRDHYICVFDESYVWIPCDQIGGGSGGNYEYTRCPEGQVLSCGTVAEAGSQNKQRPADGFAKRISGWESPHPIIRLSA